jgi:hypothetical protein
MSKPENLIVLTKFRPNPHRYQGRDQDLPTPAHLHRKGRSARPDPLLPAIQIHQAVPPAFDPRTRRQGVPAIEGGPPEAGRAVRVHLVCVLLDVVPELLVEQRGVPRPGHPSAELPMVS